MGLVPVIGMYSLYWSVSDQFKLTLASKGKYVRWSTRFPFPKVLMADSAWFNDRKFIDYFDRARESGTKLWGMQHGGRYGMVEHANIWQERAEFEICDRWFGWGWAKENMPSPRMIFEPRRKRERSEILLFAVGEDLPSETNMPWRRELLRRIPELKVRDYPWKPRPRHEYLETLERIRLAIPENCGTVLLETMAANVPTMCLWDERTRIRPEAQSYIDGLESARIFHRHPGLLAGFLKSLDIETWWHSEYVQAVRQEFVERFARSRKDWMVPWLELGRAV